jgi:hypothetical protein
MWLVYLPEVEATMVIIFCAANPTLKEEVVAPFSGTLNPGWLARLRLSL